MTRREQVAEVTAPAGPERARVGVLLGCVQREFFSAVNAATSLRTRETSGGGSSPSCASRSHSSATASCPGKPASVIAEEAAAYVGISPSLFEALVRDGRMPAPKRINSRTVWDRLQLDDAFTALPSNQAAVNPWDEITA